MAMVHRSYPGARHFLSHSNMDLSREKPVSRLVIMQARFQQRQLQEKEEKLLKLYEEQRERALDRVGVQKTSTRRWSGEPPAVKPAPGKVRSLLQSRRDLGNDKSYPLEPMPRAKTQKPAKQTKPAVLYFGGSHQDLRFSDELDFGQSFQVIDDHQLCGAAPSQQDSDDTDEDYFVKSFKNKRQFYENRFSGVSEESLSDSFDGKVFQKLPNVGSLRMSQKMESPGRYKTFVAAKTTRIPPPKSGLPTKQMLTSPPSKKTEMAPPLRPKLGLDSPTDSLRNGSASPPIRSPPTRSIATRVDSPSQLNGKSTPPKPVNGSPARKPLSPPQRATKVEDSPRAAVPPVPASRTTVPRPSSASVRTSPQKSSTPSNLAGCRICGRNFAPDRLTTHESICQKSTTKKRKVFDPVKHRVKGTEAEKYVVSGISTKNAKQAEKAMAAKPNWRKKHEEFINSIRAAKEVQVHLKKGGKLSDLPPPPPSDYSDYIQCPHCQRKFNQSAADRHIPKCATMQHNKPKKISAPVKPSSTFRKK